jgi:hypothetical protein
MFTSPDKSGQMCNALSYKQFKCKMTFLPLDFAKENCLGNEKERGGGKVVFIRLLGRAKEELAQSKNAGLFEIFFYHVQTLCQAFEEQTKNDRHRACNQAGKANK